MKDIIIIVIGWILTGFMLKDMFAIRSEIIKGLKANNGRVINVMQIIKGNVDKEVLKKAIKKFLRVYLYIFIMAIYIIITNLL